MSAQRPAPRAEIALIVDGSAPSHTAVADAIHTGLPSERYHVTRVTSESAGAANKLTALANRAVTIVAVGAAAITAARTRLPGKPLVFCQAFPEATTALATAQTWGVEALPPPTLQLKNWKSIDPRLRTIGLIVSDLDSPLVRSARDAGTKLGVDVHIEKSGSDRETLYLFRRMAASIDGLWLLPDSTALSPAILRELLNFATARGVGVLGFSEALLGRGALLSATSVTDDVAATVQRVVERVVANRTTDLPVMTPLSAARLEINSSVAGALGLARTPEIRWVDREPD